MYRIVGILAKVFLFLFIISFCIGCQEDGYEYINDEDAFLIDNEMYYPMGNGGIVNGYFSAGLRNNDNCVRYINISFYCQDRKFVDKLRVGQNITNDIVFKEVRDVSNIFLGDVSYTFVSGNIIVIEISQNKVTLEFVDVVVNSEMTDFCGNDSYHTYTLKGKLDYQK